MEKQKILVVEDEADLAQVMVEYLGREGYEADAESNGARAMERIRNTLPALLLLDLMLPGMDGLGILREVRKFSELPVILATARVEEIDRLIGLELGADDYVCKPYSPREVVARVKSVLRRSQRKQPDEREAAPLMVEVDGNSWRVKINGKRIDLTPKEFKLLQTLAAKPGHVFSRGHLLETIYEDNLDISERAVDSHMKNLRKKLAEGLPERELIRSIYGVGFVFEA